MINKKIEKITNEAVLQEYKKIANYSQEQKDQALAFLFVVVDRVADILRVAIMSKKIDNPTKISTVEEIENILSLGPSWLNYTRKTKKQK
jgi:hypothetical protein